MTLDKRPVNACSLELELENHLGLRMKKFVPVDLDLTDYDQERFKKQLDLETVKITLTSNPEKAKEYEME